MTTLNEQLANLKVIPVIAINRAEDAIPLGKALVENGMPCAEITLRTECDESKRFASCVKNSQTC